MSDIWDELAGDPVPQEGGGEFLKPPTGAWVLARTCSKEQGKAAPGVNHVEPKDGEGDGFYSFEVGLQCVGGDENVNEKHVKSIDYFSAYLNEKDKPQVCSGRLVGFLNCMFAPGVGDEFKPTKGMAKDEKDAVLKKRAAARWQATLAALRRVGTDKGITIDQYGGDKPRFLACIAALALQDEAREIIYKVGEKKNKSGNPQRSVSAFEDATAANAKERKVQRLDGEMPAGTSFGNWM